MVAVHARGPLGAERIRHRRPSAAAFEIEHALAPVAELLTLWGRGEQLDIPPVPDLGPVIARLRVAGSVLDGWELALVKQTLSAARVAAGEIKRVAEEAPAMAASLVPLPDRALDQRLVAAINDEGEVLDTASPGLFRARREIHAARDRLIKKLELVLRGPIPMRFPPGLKSRSEATGTSFRSVATRAPGPKVSSTTSRPVRAPCSSSRRPRSSSAMRSAGPLSTRSGNCSKCFES